MSTMSTTILTGLQPPSISSVPKMLRNPFTMCSNCYLISFNCANEPLAKTTQETSLCVRRLSTHAVVYPNLNTPSSNLQKRSRPSLQIFDLPLRPILPDEQTFNSLKALTDHLIKQTPTISTTSIADTTTTAYEVDMDTQDSDPFVVMDKVITVEAIGPKAVATTPLATLTAIGPKSALFVDKKVAGQLNTLQKNDERQRINMSHIVISLAYNSDFGTYILDYEGHEMDDLNDGNDIWEENDNDTNNHPKQWQASQMLCQQAFNHLITGEDVHRTDQNTVPAYQFFIEDRYSKDKF
jgi:hypothetical protein